MQRKWLDLGWVIYSGDPERGQLEDKEDFKTKTFSWAVWFYHLLDIICLSIF